MVEKRELILAIIAVAIIVGAVIFGINFFKQSSSIFKTWDDLTESQKTDIVDVFNKIANNLKDCRETQDTTCLCKDVLPSMNPFSKEVNIEFFEDRSQLKMNLVYNNAKVSGYEKITESTQIASTKEEGSEKSDTYTLKFGKKMILEGKKEFNLLKKSNNFEVLSENILRKESKGVLYFITSAISEYPICMKDRNEAITKFDSFIVKLKTENEFVVDLPLNYKIHYSGKYIGLVYETGVKVETYNQEKKVKESVVEGYDFMIKCGETTAEDEKPFFERNENVIDYLSSGDKLKITRSGENFCIDKI